MKSQPEGRSQRTVRSLGRQRSQQSDQGLRSSSLAEKASENSQRRNLLQSKSKVQSRSSVRGTLLPYEGFVKEMRMKLPTPKEKFMQFLQIPPFNRIQSHNELIALFLKNVRFFQVHHGAILANLARKIRLVELNELDQKMMLILLEGECFYDGSPVPPGYLLNRQPLKLELVGADPTARLLAINRHQYLSFLTAYMQQETARFRDFISSIQTLKMFSERTLLKFSENLSLHYYLKGQRLFKTGDEATVLFVVHTGHVSRKVVVQIEKINKIPTQKFERIVRILNKSYSHRIEFGKEDLIGVSELIDNASMRKQEIEIDEDSILLGIDRSIVEESMDDYIVDRLKKYNLKKYPPNYDQLCDNYLKEKIELRRMEERKILALQDELSHAQTDKRRQKIENIIRLYEKNVKAGDNKNLINRKLHFEIDRNK